ncbi:hypothetical protein Hanom_Chr16g01473291 [Helianthus anomalus]
MNTLANRGVPIQNSLCALCGVLDESAGHGLVRCTIAHMVWQRLFWRMKVLTGRKFDSVGELLQSVNGLGFFLTQEESYTCGVSISALEGIILEKSEDRSTSVYTVVEEKSKHRSIGEGIDQA